mmetsp:Transcript_9231/g.15353  ORF Transcript_9231/g.15353 Transcript_9231/m.15353 type:complete len:355 (+) Transcript_9231:696-1760(+)
MLSRKLQWLVERLGKDLHIVGLGIVFVVTERVDALVGSIGSLDKVSNGQVLHLDRRSILQLDRVFARKASHAWQKYDLTAGGGTGSERCRDIGASGRRSTFFLREDVAHPSTFVQRIGSSDHVTKVLQNNIILCKTVLEPCIRTRSEIIKNQLLLDTLERIQNIGVRSIGFLPVTSRIDPMLSILGKFHKGFRRKERRSKVVNGSITRVNQLGGALFRVFAIVVGTLSDGPSIDTRVVGVGSPNHSGLDALINHVYNINGFFGDALIPAAGFLEEFVGLLFEVEENSKEFVPLVNSFVGRFSKGTDSHVEESGGVGRTIVVEGYNAGASALFEGVHSSLVGTAIVDDNNVVAQQ